jgi:flagellar biosynthesis protein FlhG
MKPLDEQNHYEVLEVLPTAQPDEIERAYRVIQSAYTEGSMALYSLFEDQDSAAIRERIDLAYEVLSDVLSRRDYDTSIGVGPMRKQNDLFAPQIETTPERQARTIDTFEDLEAVAEEQGSDLDGSSLRRARMRRGIELDRISEITKISVRHLSWIEEEKFDQLPAAVYVRGFVSAYARALGLDGKRVAHGYMAHLEATEGQTRRGRLLGRK